MLPGASVHPWVRAALLHLGWAVEFGGEDDHTNTQEQGNERKQRVGREPEPDNNERETTARMPSTIAPPGGNCPIVGLSSCLQRRRTSHYLSSH